MRKQKHSTHSPGEGNPLPPSETLRESEPADAARRRFIEQYGKLALATPAAMYALMSPGRAQAQVTSLGACAMFMVLTPGQSCTFDGDVFQVQADGTAIYTTEDISFSDDLVVNVSGFRAERQPGSDSWQITLLSLP